MIEGVVVISRFFSRAECAELLREIRKLPVQRSGPNSMNKYGKNLYGRVLRARMAALVTEHVAPWSTKLFSELKPLRKHPYAFTVEYAVGKQRSLAAHFDSSAVTLNLCLGGEFKGGEVVFYGRGKKRHAVKHQIGQAIIHRGSVIHRAAPIKKGTRTNLILWCQERLTRSTS